MIEQNDQQPNLHYLTTQNVQTEEDGQNKTLPNYLYSQPNAEEAVFIEKPQQVSTGIEDSRETNAYFSKFLIIEQSCSLFNIFGLVPSIILYDLEYQENEYHHFEIKWWIFISTLFLEVTVIFRYQALIQYLKARLQIPQKENLINSPNLIYMLLEMGCYAILPYPFNSRQRIYFKSPFYDELAYYHDTEILCLLMIVRVLFLIRCIFIQSEWYRNRTQRVCNLYACEANYMFVAKSLMRTEPYSLIFSSMASLILIFGYAVRICESPLNRLDSTVLYYESYWNAMWNIIITISTVGYGDYYARTTLGRFVIFFVCIFGVFVISLMVVTLTNSLMTTSLENKAIVVLQRIEMKKQIVLNAGTVLTIMAKLGLNRKKNPQDQMSDGQRNRLVSRLRKSLNELKKMVREYKGMQDNSNISEELHRQFDNLKDEMKQLYSKQTQFLENNIEIMKIINPEDQHTQIYQELLKSRLKL